MWVYALGLIFIATVVVYVIETADVAVRILVWFMSWRLVSVCYSALICYLSVFFSSL